MPNYINQVYANIKMKEGSSSVKRLLVTIYLKGPLGTKELARETFLPRPLVTATRNEFVKLGLVERKSGVTITPKGIDYVEKVLGYEHLNKELYFRLLQEPWGSHPETAQLTLELSEIFLQRPSPDVTLDQSRATVETSIKRAILCLIHDSLIGEEILCLGDDDLVSVALSFLLKKLFGVGYKHTPITVVDTDSRILEYINQVALKESFTINTVKHDLREPLPASLVHKFQSVFTDPPYTLEGATLFLSRSLEGVESQGGLYIFFSYAHKFPEHILQLQKAILSMGLLLKRIYPSFNAYEGASIIGGHGQMIVLETTSESASLIDATYDGLLYTGDKIKTVRQYKCKACNYTVLVGQEETIKTVEILKASGCSQCGSTTFILESRRKIEDKNHGRD